MIAMHCERARDLLGAFKDGELVSDERRAVEDHLSSCRSCNEILAEDDRIARALRRCGRVAAPPSLAQRIQASLDRFATEQGSAPAQSPRWRHWPSSGVGGLLGRAAVL